MTAAVTTEVAFICVFVAPGALFEMAPGHVNGGLLALSASFAAAGGAMLTIIMAAARSSRRQPAAQ